MLLTIRAIRTGVTGHWHTVHGRHDASDGHFRIQPHGRAFSNYPGAGHRAAASFRCSGTSTPNTSHLLSRCYRPPPNLHSPSDSSARTACSLTSNSTSYPCPTALTTSCRPVCISSSSSGSAGITWQIYYQSLCEHARTSVEAVG